MVVLALLGAACGTDTTEIVAPPTTPEPTATAEPTATPEPTAIPEPTDTPEPTATLEPTATPQPAGVELLIAHDDGIDLWSDGTATPVLTGRPIAIALPDLQGGIIFQEATRDDEGLQLVPVKWIAAPGDDAITIVDEPDARWILAESVTEIDGIPTLLYRVSRILPNDCDPAGDPECLWAYQRDYLIAHDLITHSERNLGAIGSFESSGIRYSIGGDVAAFEYRPYGAPISCVGVVSARLLLDGDSADRWVGEGVDDANDVRWLVHGPCDETGSYSLDGLANAAAVAPDGSSVAVVFWRSPFDPAAEAEPMTLVVVDPTDGTELRRVAIGGPAGRPWAIDYDGENVVVGRIGRNETELAPALVEPGGTITEFAAGDRLAIVRS